MGEGSKRYEKVRGDYLVKTEGKPLVWKVAARGAISQEKEKMFWKQREGPINLRRALQDPRSLSGKKELVHESQARQR